MPKIMIVDDARPIREMIKMHLDSEGYELIEAQNGAEAIAMAAEQLPDFIILDIMMPEMDGLQACRIIRENPACASTYIAILSARGDTADKVNGLDTGADAYMVKPFEAEELKAQIRAGLRVSDERKRGMYDSLTGLLNRRAFIDISRREIALHTRHNQPLSFVMIDLDHFKQVNDTHGHDAGDEVLRSLGRIIQAGCRPSDLPFRWGGEEFAWLLPHTNLEGAFKASERLRKAIEATEFGNVGHLTASLGATEFRHKIDSVEDMYKRADKALYQAKANGRNCSVVTEQE